MDVTQEILRNTQIYGSSDYTAPHSIASSKTLNYAHGASIQKPIEVSVSVLPKTLKFQDTVGLFGTENVFVRVNVNVLDVGNKCFDEPGWVCMKITLVDNELLNTYYTAVMDLDKDLETVNTYEPAIISNQLPSVFNPYVGITLDNLKTGNQYVDAWLDVRLYTKAKEEHPYNEMFVPINDYFYIGFHARNTKRLPYNVECLIGSGYGSKNDIDPRLIAKV